MTERRIMKDWGGSGKHRLPMALRTTRRTSRKGPQYPERANDIRRVRTTHRIVLFWHRIELDLPGIVLLCTASLRHCVRQYPNGLLQECFTQ